MGLETDAASVAEGDERVAILLMRASKGELLLAQTVAAASGSGDSPPAELREGAVEVCSFGVVAEASRSDEG